MYTTKCSFFIRSCRRRVQTSCPDILSPTVPPSLNGSYAIYRIISESCVVFYITATCQSFDYYDPRVIIETFGVHHYIFLVERYTHGDQWITFTLQSDFTLNHPKVVVGSDYLCLFTTPIVNDMWIWTIPAHNKFLSHIHDLEIPHTENSRTS